MKRGTKNEQGNGKMKKENKNRKMGDEVTVREFGIFFNEF